MNRQNCEFCGKQAIYMCGQCHITAYCSPQHQLDHWKIHKEHCNLFKCHKISQQQDIITEKRLQLRTQYFQNYMHKMHNVCVGLAEQIITLERNHISTTRQIFNQLQYGIGVCLLARSKLNIKNQLQALVILKTYLSEKIHFLEDLSDIFRIGESQKFGRQTSATMKQFSSKKVSLLASIANIAHKVKLPAVMKLYHIYTNHIQKIFGKQSVEVSNCYFMIGSYYLENLSYNKAISCFLRAAELRGNKAGDCYYNLGIIFKIIKKDKIAIEMFENAAKMRELQFGENAAQVADVYHNIALLSQSLNNYELAIKNFQKIVLIYSKDKNSEDYRHAKQSINNLQRNMKQKIQGNQSNESLSKFGFNDLKKTMNLKKGKDDQLSDHTYIQQYDSDKNKNSQGVKRIKLTEVFLKKLNSLELFHLSQLQLQVQHYTSQFMVASALDSSKFLKLLPAHKIDQLRQNNLSFFKHISIQKLNGNKNSNQNQNIID